MNKSINVSTNFSKIIYKILKWLGIFLYSSILLGALMYSFQLFIFGLIPFLIFSKKFQQGLIKSQILKEKYRDIFTNPAVKFFTFFVFFLIIGSLLPTDDAEVNHNNVASTNNNINQISTEENANKDYNMSTPTPPEYPNDEALQDTTPTPTNTPSPTQEPKIYSYLNVNTLHKKYGIPIDFFNIDNFEVATLNRVIDGDTIEVKIKGNLYKVRYIGMDTPEVRQHECYAKEATTKNSKLLGKQKLILIKDVSETDKYGRLLRYVFTKDTFINGELVLQGYAKIMTIPPDVELADLLTNLQKKAQNKHSGLWSSNACKTKKVASKKKKTSSHKSTKKTGKKKTTTHKSSNTAYCGHYTCSYNAYNCSDFKTHSQAQYVYNCCKRKVGYDVHRLDRDKDGKACETLPD